MNDYLDGSENSRDWILFEDASDDEEERNESKIKREERVSGSQPDMEEEERERKGEEGREELGKEEESERTGRGEHAVEERGERREEREREQPKERREGEEVGKREGDVNQHTIEMRKYSETCVWEGAHRPGVCARESVCVSMSVCLYVCVCV